MAIANDLLYRSYEMQFCHIWSDIFSKLRITCNTIYARYMNWIPLFECRYIYNTMILKNLSYARIAFAVWITLLENVQKGKGKIKWYISYTCVFFNASVGV